MRVRTLAGRSIEQHDSPNKGGTMTGHKGIVLHIAQGSYRGTINWQMNGNQRYADGTPVTTCSTFVVGREAGEWAQMCDSNRIAWTQRAGSLDWMSIELAGFAPNAPSAWQVEACAQLLAWAHREYRVPIRVAAHPGERGLGHHSMDREWLGEEWGHEACPGRGVIGAKPAIVRRALAIANGDDDMPTVNEFWGAQFRDYVADAEGERPPVSAAHALFSTRADAHYARATAAAVDARVAALTAAVEALATKGGADAAPIVDAIERVGADLGARLAAAEVERDELRAEVAELQAALAAAGRAQADVLDT